MAEVYAGFLSHADYHIGRLLDYLDEAGQLDNTMVIVVADNGASGEGGPNGSVNENKFFNGIPDDLQQNLAMLDDLGSTKTYNHYPTGWAMAFNTPFKMWKRYEFEGGCADACILSWPKGMKSRNEIRHQYHHAIDIVPTILAATGIESPPVVNGYTQSPIQGVSMSYSFDDAKAPTTHPTQFYSMLGSRAIYHDGWKAVTTHPTIAGWGNFGKDTWELYHTDIDRAEVQNLADEFPEKLRDMIALWYSEAGANQAFPLDDRSPLEILLVPRPQLAQPRTRYVYFPGTSEVPEAQAVNVRNRSFAIGALVDNPHGTAEGVIFAQGSHFGGQALYVKDRHLHYVNNFVGIVEQRVSSSQEIPTGESMILSAAFEKEGEEPKGVAYGTLSLYFGETKVGEIKIKTQPGFFSLTGDGLCVGWDSGAPVTGDYPGAMPWRFTGGTIRRVAVDVSGEHYVDLERAAVAMMARE
jgi:arylsulfatase